MGGSPTTTAVRRVVEKLALPVLRTRVCLCCFTMQLKIDMNAINKMTPPIVPPIIAPILDDVPPDDGDPGPIIDLRVHFFIYIDD